jgi:prophage regulatory protein
MTTPTTAPAERLYRLREVLDVTGLSRAAIYRALAAGTFPLPVRIGARAIAWHGREIEEWIAARPRVGAAR